MATLTACAGCLTGSAVGSPGNAAGKDVGKAAAGKDAGNAVGLNWRAGRMVCTAGLEALATGLTVWTAGVTRWTGCLTRC